MLGRLDLRQYASYRAHMKRNAAGLQGGAEIIGQAAIQVTRGRDHA